MRSSNRILYCRSILAISFIQIANVILVHANEKSSLIVLHNSENVQDGQFQDSLLRGAFLGLMEADPDSDLEPTFIDLGIKNISKEIPVIMNMETRSIISLLSANELEDFVQEFVLMAENVNSTGQDLKKDVIVFTPRALPSYRNLNSLPSTKDHLRIVSLQPNDEFRAMALLNRILKVQTQALIPILEDPAQLPLLNIYEALSSQIFQNGSIELKSPIFISGSSNERVPIGRRLDSRLKALPDGNAAGILLLSPNWLPEFFEIFSQNNHYYRWFSHHPVQELKCGYELLFGLYSIQYVGSSNWDTPLRRNVIRDIGNLSDPIPNIISTMVAFDTATVAASYARLGKMAASKGLSGRIEFDSHGFRSGIGHFIGISALSAIRSPFAMLLQNSSWILEDSIKIGQADSKDLRGQGQGQNRSTDYQVVDYSVATSSILPRDTMLQFAMQKLMGQNRKCDTINFEFIAHDPFNQQSYTYFLNAMDLPATLIVPNQFGYGLKLFCETKQEDAEETSMEIACASTGSSVSSSVHCYPSQLHVRRKKRDSVNLNRKFPNSFYGYNDRDDSSNNLLYNIPSPPTTSLPFYMAMAMSEASNEGTSSTQSSSTESSMTTTEEASTEAPAPVVKPPDLRGILKSTLPFVGACVGAATGCSVCVVVLGRLPLGALPAVCTGPCFVTTFSNCGGLLGRTFAETTVICTELFRQGRLDMETFLVDAEFGSRIAEESLPVLQAYQKLASPIVSGMRSSRTITSAVEFFARPWAAHMLYLMGRTSKFNWLGFLVHNLGMVTCDLVGRVSDIFEYIMAFRYVATSVLLGTLLVIPKLRLN